MTPAAPLAILDGVSPPRSETLMPDRGYDFTDSALVGHLLSFTMLTALLKKGTITLSEATDLVDEALLKMEEYQSAFPEYEASFQSARNFLQKSLDGLATIAKTLNLP
jgi:hypothetical protein